MKERNSNIELLRLVLMFMIVFFHVIQFQYNQIDPTSGTFKGDSLLISFTSAAVNCFIFISGFFGINFKMKMLLSFMVQALSFSIPILLYFLIFTTKAISGYEIFRAIFPISTAYWWFLTAYIALAVISPFLNYGMEFLEKRKLVFLLSVMVFLDVMSFIHPTYLLGRFGDTPFHFVTLYCIARYMKKYDLKIKYPFFVYLGCVLCIFGMDLMNNYVFVTKMYKTIAHNNPLVILAAISLFFVFNNLKLQNKFINKLATLSFGVFLFHVQYLIVPIWVDIISYDIMPQKGFYNKALYSFIVAILIFGVSMLVEFVRSAACRPILNYFDRILVKYKISF